MHILISGDNFLDAIHIEQSLCPWGGGGGGGAPPYDIALFVCTHSCVYACTVTVALATSPAPQCSSHKCLEYSTIVRACVC